MRARLPPEDVSVTRDKVNSIEPMLFFFYQVNCTRDTA